MDIFDFRDAFFVGVFMSFMIGPVFFMLIQTSILKGARAAIAFDIGVLLGDIFFMLVAYFGSRSLLEKIKDDPRLFFVGGLVLVVYGLITYLDKSNKKEVVETSEIIIPEENNYFKLALKGFFLNFINVGVLAFWLGLVVVVGPTYNMEPQPIFWYFTTVIIGYFLTDVGKILLAKQLKAKMTPTVIYKFKKIMGVILIICGVFLILQGFIPKEQLKDLI